MVMIVSMQFCGVWKIVVSNLVAITCNPRAKLDSSNDMINKHCEAIYPALKDLPKCAVNPYFSI